ncbi:MAG: hydrogenase maturation protease, partial [Pseudomonadota bacterium]
VLGIGSPFGADRVGWEVIERLRETAAREPGLFVDVVLESADRPGIGLLEKLRGFERVILVDAVMGAEAPGTLYRVNAEDLLRTSGPLSSHELGVADALALAATTGDLPRDLVIMGVAVPQSGPAPSGLIADTAAAVQAEILQTTKKPPRGAAVNPDDG